MSSVGKQHGPGQHIDPVWIKQYPGEMVALEQCLARYNHCLEFSHEGELLSLSIEWSNSPKNPGRKQWLMTQYGDIGIEKFGLFISTLSGIPLTNLNDELYTQYAELALSELPRSFKDIFGWLSLQDNDRDTEDSCGVVLRVSSADVDIATTAYASPSVWQELIDNTNFSRSKRTKPLLVNTQKMSFVFANARISQKEFLIMEPGSILRLDNPKFTSKGEGTFRLGGHWIDLVWVERGLVDVFRVENNRYGTEMMGNEEENLDKLFDESYDYDDEPDPILKENEISIETGVVDAVVQELPEGEANSKALSEVCTADTDSQDLPEGGPTINMPHRADLSLPESRSKVSIEGIPITIDVVVGSFIIDLDQLKNLSKGDLINVDPNYQNKVSLQVNNTEFGVGQIVSFGGEVAIQIQRLWGVDHAPI